MNYLVGWKGGVWLCKLVLTIVYCDYLCDTNGQ